MITIRPALASEITDLQYLNNEAFSNNHHYDEDLVMDWSSSEDAKEYFVNLLNNPHAICLIAENDGKKIGYLGGTKKIFGHRKSRYFEVENIGVIPEYQSKGVGTLLLNESIKLAKEKGFEKIFLDTYSANRNAISFYKKHGFVELGVSFEKKI